MKLEQISQRSCGCPIPGSAQGQGFGQPDLMGGNPAHGRELELDGLKVPSDSKYSISMIL